MNNFVKLKPGDFVTHTNRPGTFGIYEGYNKSRDNNCFFNQYSLALYFEPNKFQSTPSGYKEAPSLEINSLTTTCKKTIDTESENYWWKKLTKTQRIEADEKLKEYGFMWDDETLSLIVIETGEIIYQYKDNDNDALPTPMYNGEVINPSNKEFRDILMKTVKKAAKTTCIYPSHHVGGCLDDNYWNSYEGWD